MQHRQQVLSRYRELLRLVQRLPDARAAAARGEARATLRQHQHEQDPQARLQQLKELVARISFLRITTPRRAGEPLSGGTFVLREGELVQGGGEHKGSRCVKCGEAKQRVCAVCMVQGAAPRRLMQSLPPP
jgi:hypothetical protein